LNNYKYGGTIKMTSINWAKIKHFSPSEFPEDPDKYAEPELIYTLDKIRRAQGKPIYPSPVKGALARFDGSERSQHYAVGRKSTGVDIFPECVPIQFMLLLMKFENIKGIGIYRDTTGINGKPWVMFHIDIRERGFNDLEPLIWIAIKDMNYKTNYIYPQSNNYYWNLLSNKIFTEYYDKN
jgi:hypothetical protein